MVGSLTLMGSFSLDGHKFQGPQFLDQVCEQTVIEDWVFHVPHVGMFLGVVIHRGLRLLSSALDLSTLVPECHADPGQPWESILDVLSVVYLNSQLAAELRLRWRLLFSTQLHGQSFSQLCSRITQRGPCLLVLEDRDGHVFGGFASCSWEVKPQFQGKTWRRRRQWVLCWLGRTVSLAQPSIPRSRSIVDGGRPHPLLVAPLCGRGLNCPRVKKAG